MRSDVAERRDDTLSNPFLGRSDRNSKVNLPVVFEEDVGQAPADVKYIDRTRGAEYFLESSGIETESAEGGKLQSIALHFVEQHRQATLPRTHRTPVNQESTKAAPRVARASRIRNEREVGIRAPRVPRACGKTGPAARNGRPQ